MQSIEKSINKLRSDFNDLEKQVTTFEKEIPEAVTNIFTEIAKLNESLHNEASIGSQIVSILKGTWEICVW